MHLRAKHTEMRSITLYGLHAGVQLEGSRNETNFSAPDKVTHTPPCFASLSTATHHHHWRTNFGAKGNSKTEKKEKAAGVSASAEQKWCRESVNWAQEIQLCLPSYIHLRVCFAHKPSLEFSSYFLSGIPASGQFRGS